jgi:Tfp pilus assembly protein PilE
VIGILAAITIVSYSEITSKATAAGILSDLTNNKKLLALYNVDYGSYPTALDANNCPTAPNADQKYCLKTTSGTAFVYSSTGQSFRINASKS